MGRDWLPGGWSSSSGMSWPVSADSSTALQLSGQRYQTSVEFKDNYFNAQTDNYVTMVGYRLWIDQADRSDPPTSPFMGFSGEWLHAGVGLRDGWRYGIPSAPGEWSFTRPTLATAAPVLKVEPEFITSDGTVHASQVFQQWQACREVNGSTAQRWQEEPGQKTYSAFLRSDTKSQTTLHPVVELKWDIDQPMPWGFAWLTRPPTSPLCVGDCGSPTEFIISGDNCKSRMGHGGHQPRHCAWPKAQAQTLVPLPSKRPQSIWPKHAVHPLVKILLRWKPRTNCLCRSCRETTIVMPV